MQVIREALFANDQGYQITSETWTGRMARLRREREAQRGYPTDLENFGLDPGARGSMDLLSSDTFRSDFRNWMWNNPDNRSCHGWPNVTRDVCHLHRIHDERCLGCIAMYLARIVSTIPWNAVPRDEQQVIWDALAFAVRKS